MKTSAHPTDTAAPGSRLAEFTGTVMADAQARMKPIDLEGHMQPVLIIDVRLDCATCNHLRSEQIFPSLTAATDAARRYRKGLQVRVQAPLAWLTLRATHVAHIHAVPTEQRTSTPPVNHEETTV